MARDIVVGCDGSECSYAALDVAIQTAKELRDRLVIVFAYEPPGRMGDEFNAYQNALKERGQKFVAEAEAKASEADVEAITKLIADRPSEALSEAAIEHAARMIVVGSYGESPLTSAILGSVPHKLLQISATPVLCVRA